MAVRPGAVRGGGLSGAQIGLIVFAFVSVASFGGFIFQLTRVKEADERAATAQRQIDRLGRPAGAVGGYYENEATARNATVFAVMSEDLDRLGRLIAGETGTIGRSLEQKANELLSQIEESTRGFVNRKDTLLTALRKLQDRLVAETARNERLSTELRNREQQVAALTQQLKAARDQFDEQIARTRADYEAAVAEFTRKLEAKDSQLAELQSALEAREQELSRSRRDIEAEKREYQLQLTRKERQLADLQKKIQDLKGSFDPEAILRKADGRIVRAIPGSKIVYINLGTRDKVRLGMTFEVYSQTGAEPRSFRGKASLEVVTLMDNTSECVVTRAEPDQPIMEGDIVVNLAYERNRQPKFVVRGEFDLDFDGQPDLNGAEQIKSLIRQWGGQVVPDLDESVDYVVIGLAPRAPSVGPDASDIVRDQEERRLLELSEFRQLIDRARAMYIPVITQNQFLFLTGYAGDAVVRQP
jgi:hypothetical protein